MNLDFIAIDFETATGNMNSACAVGIALVEDLRIADTFYSLLQPPGLLFHPGNIQIHGITPEMAADAPTLDQLWPEIAPYFTPHCPVAAHNARFDMSVLRKSCSASIPNFPYVDTMEIALPLVQGSRSLAHCSQVLNIDLEHHHNALDDACACAQIAICGLQQAGCLSMWEFLAQAPHVRLNRFRALAPQENFFQRRPSRRFDPARPTDLRPAAPPDPGHPLFGKSLVFTGELSMDRKEAMQLAVNAGALVKSAVTRKTDYLVAGRQDLSLVGEGGLSSKEEKAIGLQKEGLPIRIIGEQEFLHLIHQRPEP